MNKLLKFIQQTKNIRIKSKLMISYIMVVFIPVLIVGIFLTTAFRQNVLDRATEQTLNNVDKIKQRTADTLRMPIEISNNLLVDTRLSKVVNTNYDTAFDVVQALWDYRDFKDYLRLYKELSNFRFYTENHSMLSNWEFINPDDKLMQSFWYNETMNLNKGEISWYHIPDETKENRKYLSLIRKIDFPEYRTKGILVIDVSQNVLNAILSQEPFDTMILDDKGVIVAAKNTAWVDRNIAEMDFAKGIIDKTKGTYEFNYDGKPSRIVIEDLLPPSSKNGLKIVSVFTIDSIVSGANRISILGFSIILISLLIALVLIYFSSFFLTKRMLQLNLYLNKVAMGDLNVISPIDGRDEIGLLSRQFNNMVSSIRELMEEVSESQKQKNQLELRQREIKLKMMASQINPHFLFNALESIRMKAHVKGETEIANVVRLLGKLIRRNIEVGAGKIHVKEELEVVRCYLEIQKFRYGENRLAFDMDIDLSGQMIEIPALIIQPLVENAVVHGLENVGQGGSIKVTSRVAGDVLKIEVVDNGIGITEEKMREIDRALHDMEEETEYRIGLRNVHQRLVLTYGESYGLIIKSKPGFGTSLSFELPIGGK